jgi:hypothetical protein
VTQPSTVRCVAKSGDALNIGSAADNLANAEKFGSLF